MNWLRKGFNMHTPNQFRGMAAYLALVLLLIGCATEKSASSVDMRTSLVTIAIAKGPQKGADCAVTVSIENRTGVAWDGISYHIALHDKRGVAAGRLMGSPRTRVKPGDTLEDRSIVAGSRCEIITRAAPVYFGYYPTSKKQVTVHNTNVRVKFD
jgi:hypothetical protein